MSWANFSKQSKATTNPKGWTSFRDKTGGFHAPQPVPVKPIPTTPQQATAATFRSMGQNVIAGVKGIFSPAKPPVVPMPAPLTTPQQPVKLNPAQFDLAPSTTPATMLTPEVRAKAIKDAENFYNAVTITRKNINQAIGKAGTPLKIFFPDPAYAPAEEQIGKLQKDYDKSLNNKVNQKAGIFTGSMLDGLTGGIIKPSMKTPTALDEKVLSAVGGLAGMYAAFSGINAVVNKAFALGSLDKMFQAAPKVQKFVVPMVKNIATFDIYGQLDPDTQDRTKKLFFDTITAIPFTLLNKIHQGRYKVPASFGLGFTLAKLSGASDEDAIINGTLLGLLSAGEVLTSPTVKTGARTVTPKEVRDFVASKGMSDTPNGKGMLDLANQAEAGNQNIEIKGTYVGESPLERLLNKKQRFTTMDYTLVDQPKQIGKPPEGKPEPKPEPKPIAPAAGKPVENKPTLKELSNLETEARKYKSAEDFANELGTVPGKQIGVVNPNNITPRDEVDTSSPSFTKLVESVKKDGITEPVIVQVENGKLTTTDGSHRVMAARQAGVHVPVIVTKGSLNGMRTIENFYKDAQKQPKTTKTPENEAVQSPKTAPISKTDTPVTRIGSLDRTRYAGFNVGLSGTQYEGGEPYLLDKSADVIDLSTADGVKRLADLVTKNRSDIEKLLADYEQLSDEARSNPSMVVDDALKALTGEGLSYTEVEESGIDWVAKAAGVDGIKYYENQDVPGEPTTALVYKKDLLKPVEKKETKPAPQKPAKSEEPPAAPPHKDEKPVSKPDTKQLTEQATELGTQAFKDGKKRVPAQNKELMKSLEGLEVGEAAPVLQAYTDAWDKANLAEPVEPDISQKDLLLSMRSGTGKFEPGELYTQVGEDLAHKVIVQKVNKDGTVQGFYIHQGLLSEATFKKSELKPFEANVHVIDLVLAGFGLKRPSSYGYNEPLKPLPAPEKPSIIEANEPTTPVQPPGLPNPGETRPATDRGLRPDVDERTLHDTPASDGQSGAGLEGSRSPKRGLGKTGRQDLNTQAVSILVDHDYSTKVADYTAEELNTLRLYSGAGGKEAAGASGKGLLSEYYTPPEVSDKLWEIARQLAPEAKSMLEPAMGTGALLKGKPETMSVTGYEFQRVSGTIAKLFNPEATISIGNGQEFDNPGNFETAPHKPEYDLVVGNPPFGDRGSFLKGKGEEPKINRWEEYFIKRGLDSLKDNGSLVYVVNSGFLRTGADPGKEEIVKAGDLVAAYRLPEGIFADTSIGTDIVVFQKRPALTGADSTERLELTRRLQSLTNNHYFEKNPDNIAGRTEQRFNRFGREEDYVSGNLEDVKRLNITIEEPEVKPAPVSVKPTSDRYFIIKRDTDGTNKFQEVKGTPVEIGLPDAFVHKTIDNRGWVVSEGKSGKALTSPDDTRAGAILRAKETIERHNVEEINTLVEKSVTENGASPRYTDKPAPEKPKVSYTAKVVKHVAKLTKDGKLPAIIKPEGKLPELVRAQTIVGAPVKDSIETTILKNTRVDGSVERTDKAEDKYLNYHQGKFYHDLNYFSGDIYQKLEDLVTDKPEIVKQMGEGQYEKQLRGLQAALPQPVKIDDITFDPLDRYITGMELAPGENGRPPMKISDQFISYLNSSNNSYSYGVDRYDVRNYVMGFRMSRGKKEVMGKIKADASRLFNYFVRNVLAEDVQQQIVDKFNREKNSYVNPDYSKIPTEVKDMAKYFRGKTFKLSNTQANGVSFLTNRGVGLIAYGVGVGKTHTLLTATMVALQRGWNKRPAFVVPKSTLSRTWIDTVKSMFPKVTIVNLGGLTKPDVDRLEKTRGKDRSKWIKDGEVAIITHEGLLRLALKADELNEALMDLDDALSSESKTERERENKAQKIVEIVGKAQYKAGDIYLSDLGIDHISVDEVHNFRKIFQGAKPEVLNPDGTPDKSVTRRFGNVIGGTPSKQAQQLFIIAQHILKRNGNRGVYLASATPFENHATEVYNILSLIARDRMRKIGIFNINDFFALFSNFETELEKNVQGEWVNKEKMKSFKNLPQLQKLLREFVDYQEDMTLVRPKRRVLTPHLQMSAAQEENLFKIQEMLKPADGRKPEDGAVLKASTYSVANSISPYFIKEWQPDTVTPEELVDNSPKLKYAMELVKKLKADQKTSKYGTFLYIGANGIDYHNHLIDYAVRHLGFKPTEVAVINGTTPNDEREAIKDEFNSGKVKLLIGGDPTKEGIDLQRNGYTTINVALGWNPTEVAQVEGRVWRQGNFRSIAPLVYPLVENSGDITVYNKFEEKGSRINDLFSYRGQIFDVGELDPREKKLALMTKPEDKAAIEIEIDKAEAQNQLMMYGTDIANLRRLLQRRGTLETDLKSVQERLDTKRSSWGTPLEEDQLEAYKKEQAKLKREQKSIEQYLERKEITDIPAKIAELEQMQATVTNQIKAIQDTYAARLERFQREYNDMIAHRKSVDDHVKDFLDNTADLRELSDEEVKKVREKLIYELEKSNLPKVPAAEASMGAAAIGNYETRPSSSSDKDFKLHNEVKALVDKYAQRIGEGYLPKKASGVYYENTDNIRVSGMNDLSSGLHEITHRLDSKYKITEALRRTVGESVDGKPIYDPQTLKIRKQLTQLYVSYYAGGLKTHPLRKRVREGMATLIQKYAEAPTTIAQEYPDLVKQFLAEGGEFYQPVIGDILTDVSKIIENYQGLDPLDKIGARVTSDNPRYDRQSFMNLSDKIRTQLADTVYPIEKLAILAGKEMTQSDPSLYIRQYLQINGVLAANLAGKHGYFRYYDGGFHQVRDYNWKTLVDKLGKDKTLEPFGYYLVARAEYYDYQDLKEYKTQMDDLRAIIEKVGLDEAAEMIGDDGKTILESFREARKRYEEQFEMLRKDGITEQEATDAYLQNKEKFVAEEQMFDELVAEDVELLHDKEVGMMSNEKYQDMKSRKGYASRKRLFFDEIVGEQQPPVQVRVGKQTISSLMRRKGSSRTILNPVYSAIRNHSEILKKTYRQVVYNKINALAATFPELAQPQQLIRLRQPNGSFHYPQDRDPNIIMGYQNGKRVPVLWDNFVKTTVDELITPANYGVFEQILLAVSRGFTKGTTGLFPAFALTNFAGDQITAVANTTNDYLPLASSLNQLGKAVTGRHSAEAGYYLEYMVLGGERQTFVGWQDLSPQELADKIQNERKGILKAVDLVNAGLDVLAIPAKYSEIVTRATEYIKARKAGKPQVVALEEAGRVTAPFHHVGKWGGHFGRTFVKSIPFFNPSIQVLEQLQRSGRTRKGATRIAFVFAAITAAVVGAFALLMAKGTEDQKRLYKDLESNELMNYIWLPNPDGKTLIRIKVQQFGIIGNLISMAFANQMLNANYQVGDFITGATQFLPEQFNIAEPVKAFLSWIPPLIKVPMMTALNVKDYPRILPIENQYLQSLPVGLRANESTSLVAKELGKRTGLSPVKLDYLITGLLGRATGFVMGKGSAYNPFSSVTRAEYWTSGRTIQQYYEITAENDQKYKAVKDGLLKPSAKEKNTILRVHQRSLVVEKYLKAYRDLDIEKEPDKASKLRNLIIKQIEQIMTDANVQTQNPLMPQAYAADIADMSEFQQSAYQRLSTWTQGEASYYNPTNPKETKPGANGIGAYGRKIESGSVAFGNRVFQDQLKKGQEIFIQVKGFENVKTPYGMGIFRIDDTMNARYNKEGKFNIDFNPVDLDKAKKSKGRYKIQFRIVDPKNLPQDKPNFENDSRFIKRYYA